jgi:hypothetical protein
MKTKIALMMILLAAPAMAAESDDGPFRGRDLLKYCTKSGMPGQWYCWGTSGASSRRA